MCVYVCVFSVTHNLLSKCCFQETALTIARCGSRHRVMRLHSTSHSLKNIKSQSHHKARANPSTSCISIEALLRTCISPRLVPTLRVLPSSLQHRDEMGSLPVSGSKAPTIVHVSAFQMYTEEPSANATVLLQLQSRRFESKREQMSTHMIYFARFKNIVFWPWLA